MNLPTLDPRGMAEQGQILIAVRTLGSYNYGLPSHGTVDLLMVPDGFLIYIFLLVSPIPCFEF